MTLMTFFSGVIVRICVKTLVCEPLTTYVNAGISLQNSLV